MLQAHDIEAVAPLHLRMSKLRLGDEEVDRPGRAMPAPSRGPEAVANRRGEGRSPPAREDQPRSIRSSRRRHGKPAHSVHHRYYRGYDAHQTGASRHLGACAELLTAVRA